MEKELRLAIGEVDDEGLLFLLRQAQVLIHNARVEKMNRDTAAKGRGKSTGAAAADRAARKPGPAVSFEEGEGGKAIFLTIGGARKVLTRTSSSAWCGSATRAETKSEALRPAVQGPRAGAQ